MSGNAKQADVRLLLYETRVSFSNRAGPELCETYTQTSIHESKHGRSPGLCAEPTSVLSIEPRRKFQRRLNPTNCSV